MREFLVGWASRVQNSLLERAAGPGYPFACPSCKTLLDQGRGDHAFRCSDCYDPSIQCARCVVTNHYHNPFHRIEDWDPQKKFWIRRSLGTLTENTKLSLNLGHDGQPCPTTVREPRPMTIVHDHGIHPYNVVFCRCVDMKTQQPTPEPLQLIRFGLWPGSWVRPETAFSLSCLRDHQLLSLQSAISTEDYVEYLKRTMDNVCADDVPVCSPTF